MWVRSFTVPMFSLGRAMLFTYTTVAYHVFVFYVRIAVSYNEIFFRVAMRLRFEFRDPEPLFHVVRNILHASPDKEHRLALLHFSTLSSNRS